MKLSDLGLFALCVGIWGTTWFAITYQLGAVAPSVSVAIRFGLAALLALGYCALRGMSLRFDRRTQLLLACMGLSMFTVGYLFVYVAETKIVSALVAVGYSASPLANQLGSRLVFRTIVRPRLAFAGLLGVVGIVGVYWPEVTGQRASTDVLLGLGATAIGVITSTIGTLFATRLSQLGVPIWPKMGLAMGYGAVGSALVGLMLGASFHLPLVPAYFVSLVYLSVFGSVVAFASYLTLLERVGSTRTGYVGVMVPIVALLVSSWFEGYVFGPLTFVGIAVAVAGNVLMIVSPERSSAG